MWNRNIHILIILIIEKSFIDWKMEGELFNNYLDFERYIALWDGEQINRSLSIRMLKFVCEGNKVSIDRIIKIINFSIIIFAIYLNIHHDSYICAIFTTIIQKYMAVLQLDDVIINLIFPRKFYSEKLFHRWIFEEIRKNVQLWDLVLIFTKHWFFCVARTQFIYMIQYVNCRFIISLYQNEW